MIVFNEQQLRAIDAVENWLKDPYGSQVFRLFGYAGTGKTTIAKTLADSIGNTLFATFTGKAALMLRKRGCENAQTIHSLIYKVQQDQKTGKLYFSLNEESALLGADLLVVDEVSMVNDEMAQDLLSYGTRILVLGDPFQLPPIKGTGYFTQAEPDVLLTDIRRQAADSPIIALSAFIREGKILTPGVWGQNVEVLSSAQAKKRMETLLRESDISVVGTNSTRMAINMQARTAKGLVGAVQSWHPIAGDRLICLRNDHKKGLLNGGTWSVKEVEDNAEDFDLQVQSDDMPLSMAVRCLKDFFCGKDAALDWRIKLNYDEFTFAQAVTCHKFQGSQAPYVTVFDQSKVFKEYAQNWLYTAVTRAEERIVVLL